MSDIKTFTSRVYGIPNGFNFIAMDMSGDFHCFEKRPVAGEKFWMKGGNTVYLRYMRGGANGDTVDWKECLWMLRYANGLYLEKVKSH